MDTVVDKDYLVPYLHMWRQIEMHKESIRCAQIAMDFKAGGSKNAISNVSITKIGLHPQYVRVMQS